MRGSILETVDENMQDQAQGVRELIEREIREALNWSATSSRNEEIRAGSDLLQVSDPAGNWIYRSRTMAHFGPATPGEAGLRSRLSSRMACPCGC